MWWKPTPLGEQAQSAGKDRAIACASCGARFEYTADVRAADYPDACPQCGYTGTTSITVELADDTIRFLRVLASSPAVGAAAASSPAEDVAAVLAHLAHHAADGVRRPGAWERGWVEQCFGDWDVDELEPDPDARFFLRPRE